MLGTATIFLNSWEKIIPGKIIHIKTELLIKLLALVVSCKLAGYIFGSKRPN